MTVNLSHGCSISYLNPNFKSRDIISLISLWIGTITNGCAALQCSVKCAVTDKHPAHSSHSIFPLRYLAVFLPSRLLVPSPNPFSVLLPPLNSLSLPLFHLPFINTCLSLFSRFSPPLLPYLSFLFLIIISFSPLIFIFSLLLSDIVLFSYFLSQHTHYSHVSFSFASPPCIFSTWQC